MSHHTGNLAVSSVSYFQNTEGQACQPFNLIIGLAPKIRNYSRVIINGLFTGNDSTFVLSHVFFFFLLGLQLKLLPAEARMHDYNRQRIGRHGSV